MALPKYATKEEIQLALIAYEELDIPNHPIVPREWITIVGPSPTQWERLLKTTLKLYEVLDSLQGSLRLLEESVRGVESREERSSIVGHPGALPEHLRKLVTQKVIFGPLPEQPGWQVPKPPLGSLDRAKEKYDYARARMVTHHFEELVKLGVTFKSKKPEGGYAE